MSPDLGHFREHYDRSVLRRADLAADPIEQFGRWFEAWMAEPRYDAAACVLASLMTAVPSAQAASSVRYVALGDSYSSGVGAGSYTAESGDCLRSTKAYSQLWANAHAPASYRSVACSGATTSDVNSSQLSALSSSTTLVSIGMARWGVRPVVLMPNFRSRGSRSSMTRQRSTRSLRVVGSPPETLAFSTFFQSGEANTRSTSSRLMSSLRSPRFQLLHISQRASQTNVQWKMSTVGWMGRNRAT